MHLRDVEIFCDVVACRSFSRAAEQLKVSQSAVSQTIHQLEKRLGVTLIDRSTRPFELTPGGELYFDRCRNLLGEFRAVEDQVQLLGNKVTGRLRVCAIYSIGLLQMNSYVRNYQATYPDVDLKLQYVHPNVAYESIQRDEVDLALVSFPRDSGDFRCEPWIEQELVLVVSPEHTFADLGQIPIAKLANESFIGFTTDLKMRRELDRWMADVGVGVDIVHEFDNVELVKRAVEIGLGVSVLPRESVERELSIETLVAIPFQDVQWVRPLGIIHRSNRPLSSAANKFISMLREDPKSKSGGQPKTKRFAKQASPALMKQKAS